MKCDRYADSGILEESSFLPPGPSSISFRVKWKYGSEISGRNRICHRMKWVLTARNRSAPPELSLPKSSSRTLSNHHQSPTTPFASLPRQPRRWGRGARPVEAGRGTRGTAGDDCHRRHWMPLCRSNTHGPPRGGGEWWVGQKENDPFSVLLVNLQLDSGRGRGHPSARSGLQAMSVATRPRR